MADLVMARFGIDPRGPHEIFEGWHDPKVRWNGWACPSFDRRQVERIEQWLRFGNAEVDDFRDKTWITWDGDVALLVGWSGDDAYEERYAPDADGRYDIGSHSWTWLEVEP